MSKNLVIVESPAKAKKIGQFLGKDYAVMASVGHVRDLPPKELGVDVENGFVPKYVDTTRGKKILKEIKAEAKKCEKVFLAPDPDRDSSRTRSSSKARARSSRSGPSREWSVDSARSCPR